jgi:hypothetical protein
MPATVGATYTLAGGAAVVGEVVGAPVTLAAGLATAEGKVGAADGDPQAANSNGNVRASKPALAPDRGLAGTLGGRHLQDLTGLEVVG